MNEEEVAARFYEEHGDDADLWGPAERGRTSHKRGQMATTITVRFPTEEARIVREIAKRTGQTYSEVIRGAVRALAHPAASAMSSVNRRVMFAENVEHTPSDYREFRVHLEGQEGLSYTSAELALR